MTRQFLSRETLIRVFGEVEGRQFEAIQEEVADTSDAVRSNVEQTERLQDATFLVLSANAELPNERVLTLGEGLRFILSDGEAKLDTTGLVRSEGGHTIRLVAAGDTEVVLPLTGFIVTREASEVLENKTLAAPLVQGLKNAADDAAAAGAGVPVNGLYRNGSALMIRVT